MKTKKKSKNSVGYEMTKTRLTKAIDELALSADWRGQRRRALKKSMKAAAAAGDLQSARSFAYQLAREKIVKVRKAASDVASAALAGVGTSGQLQPREILNASARSVRNAQRKGDRGAGRSQYRALRDAAFGDYTPESPDVDATQLESQSRIIAAERDLRKATTPEAREAAAYRLTRARLIEGHRLGEI